MECPPRTGEGPASGDRAFVVAEVLQRRLALRAPHLGSSRVVASYYSCTHAATLYQTR